MMMKLKFAVSRSSILFFLLKMAKQLAFKLRVAKKEKSLNMLHLRKKLIFHCFFDA
jgi:hypothetical protein